MTFTTIFLLASLAVCVFGQFPTQNNPFSGLNPYTPRSPFSPSNLFGSGNRNQFGSLFGQNNNPFSSRRTGFPGRFPSIGGPGRQRRRRVRRLATVYMRNKANDELSLTLESEEYLDDDNRRGNIPFLFGRGYDDDDHTIRVHGVFKKGGAETGTPHPDSLHGTYYIMVMSNGNLDAHCLGTGKPYYPGDDDYENGDRDNGDNGRNSFGSLPNAFNPFNAYTRQQSYYGYNRRRKPLYVSTPLHAVGGTSTVEGVLKGTKLGPLLGRCMQLCVDGYCNAKTDMCGHIARDQYSVAQFKSMQQRYQLHAQAGLPTDPHYNNPLLGDFDDPFDNNDFNGFDDHRDRNDFDDFGF